MKKYLKLMRINHYMKNGLIFLPLFFSHNFFNVDSVLKLSLSFISFSFLCSTIYIINDLMDIEKDKKHQFKKNRPLASGKVKKENALLLMLILLILSITVNYFACGNNYYSYLWLTMYLLFNIAYSFGLKNIPILDVIILSSGFLIRLLYGAEIVDVSISNWLYLTVMSMAFYLGLGKRRKELEKNGFLSRKVLSKYSKSFLDKNMYLCMGLTIVFYSLWTIDPSIANTYSAMIWTVPIVLIICMLYSLNVEGSSFGDPVDVVLKDKILLFLIAAYIIIVFGIFYVKDILSLI